MLFRSRQNNTATQEFESWIQEVTEGTWEMPDVDDTEQLDKIMGSPPVRAGNDGEDAIGQLYNIIGDDELYDQITARAQEEGPDADVRPEILEWLHDNGYADLVARYTQNYTQQTDPLQAQDLANQQDQADTAAANRPHGGEGTANPSPAVNPANEDSDPLDFIRSLAGIR